MRYKHVADGDEVRSLWHTKTAPKPFLFESRLGAVYSC